MFKKIFTGLMLSSILFGANAMTWFQNGVLMGNVCRAGAQYFVFYNSAAPVGTSCWFNSPYGIVYGSISSE